MNNNNTFTAMILEYNKLPKVTRINLNDPETLNEIVGNYIEVSAIGLSGVVALCNKSNLEAGNVYNPFAINIGTSTMIIAAMEDNEFTSLSAEQILKVLSYIDELRSQQSLMVN